MKKSQIILGIVCCMLFCACEPQTSVSSPDGKLSVACSVDSMGRPMYQVSMNGEDIIYPSQLGLQLAQTDLSEGFTLLRTQRDQHNETWETTWGEDHYIVNHYNQLSLFLRHRSGIEMQVCFRVFNDGWAMRYMLPEMADTVLINECTSYQFAKEPTVWSIPWRTEYYEALWQPAPMSEIDTVCSPITLQWGDNLYAWMHEAALYDYPAQNYYYADGQLRTYLTPWSSGDAAYLTTPFATPWRMMVLSNELSGLVESRMLLNLNEPCKMEDTSWIKPMKFIGIWWGMHLETMTWHQGPIHGATTENMKRYIDFAADNGFGGVLAEGWNTGWEDWGKPDVVAQFSFTTPYSDYDLEYLTNYAHQRGVQIIFHHETQGNAASYQHQLDTAFAYMQQHGMHAVKTGYVAPTIQTIDGIQYNRSQSGVRHYRKVIETAATYQVSIDNHEPVMPTGLQRTYPNLMTQEGIRGQEWNAWSQDGGSPCEHVTVLPFTRMLAGPADYTPGVFNFDNPVYPNTRVHATLANQLGLFVVLYSPLQMACDLPENYMLHPEEFEFIRCVPCDWERSIMLDGQIGDYIVMARQARNTDNWYIGAVTDEQARSTTITWADFLGKGDYQAIIYQDAAQADWQTNPYATAIDTLSVHRHSDPLTINMAPGGGFAIRVEKQN